MHVLDFIRNQTMFADRQGRESGGGGPQRMIWSYTPNEKKGDINRRDNKDTHDGNNTSNDYVNEKK